MDYIHEIKLDMSLTQKPPVIQIESGDGKTHYVKAVLCIDGKQFKPEDGVSAQMRCRKQDMSELRKDATVNSDGIVTAKLTGNVTDQTGKAVCDIALTKSGALLSSQVFIVDIRKPPIPDGAIK